uniref:Uncharacterized protein n=1 Tax=Candidatus Kentrum sp. MB TaxID=2138164 RepID=A0A450XH03_9GAMM|nr:MAG: hypothetical protein BECKMB1821G_GA0114241_103716 [Candidatus Kentron sp. MB]
MELTACLRGLFPGFGKTAETRKGAKEKTAKDLARLRFRPLMHDSVLVTRRENLTHL